jgi:hypothetical protein
MRRSIFGPVLIVAALAAAGCEAVEDDGSSAPADTAREVTEVPSTETTLPTEQIGSCVERVQFGAYTGDTFWTQVWNDVGQTVEGAQTFCSQLAIDDPVGLLSIHGEWGEAEAFLAAAEPAPAAAEPAPTTTLPPVTLPPTTVPPPAPTSPPPPENSCDPAYPTVCIPPNSPDLNCGDISFRRFKVLPPDPHGFDQNNDGVGCEG